jgi:4-hydroxybenzoate polyprenyltransferase
MRPTHWVKNGFVLAPLLFAGMFDQLAAWLAALAAMGSFCLLSSSVYLLNDVCDRHRDAAHPDKCQRPIASGRLPVAWALSAAAVLVLVGGAIAALVEWFMYDPTDLMGGMGLIVWTGLYLVLNVLYSTWLKRKTIVDVIVVALGFVLRAMAGAAAIDVPISAWLVLCTFTLCLFIALAKRRSEIDDLSDEQAVAVREANRGYVGGLLDQMLAVAAALAIVSYSLYCLAPRTVEHFGSANMIWTIPLVVYGLFRYWALSRNSRSGDPVQIIVRDKIMWAIVVIYALLAGVIIAYGDRPEFDILHA